jgi:hypothetical protein
MKKIYRQLLAAAIGIVAFQAQAQQVATFEDFNLFSESYENGSGPAVEAKFNSGNAEFPNVYETQYGGYWSSGWAYSSITNDTSAGYGNIYGSFAAGGNMASSNYLVGQPGSILRITGADKGKVVKGLYVTNGTFAGLSMTNGDFVAKKFGGVSGNDPDFFVLTIKSYYNGVLNTDSVNFYLADFRFANNTQDYIVKNWAWVDLTSLGNTDSLLFGLSSSDNDPQYGMNTPAFFCIDDVVTHSDTSTVENLTLAANSFWNKRNTKLTKIFSDGGVDFPNAYNTSSYGDYWSSGFAVSNMTDTITPGYDNPYSSYSGIGADSSETYAVVQKNAKAYSNPGPMPIENYLTAKGVYVTNSTYAALSMKNGDAFAKKFGGVSGNDEDWFKLSVVGFYAGAVKEDTVEFYLADYRFADNSQDYIVKDWAWINLESYGKWDSLQFLLTSSDVGQFGMNTPGFFCLDNFEQELHTGVSEVANAVNNSNMYPNPAKDVLTVDVNLVSANVAIYDLSGRKVLSTVVSKGNPHFSVASLEPGLFIVKIESDGVVATRKLIKE